MREVEQLVGKIVIEGTKKAWKIAKETVKKKKSIAKKKKSKKRKT